MTDDATPAKVRLTDGLGPLPAHSYEWLHCGKLEATLYTADQMRAYAAAAVAAERERWIGGVRVQIPTETMEAEFTAQRRIGVNRERERIKTALLAMHERDKDRHNYWAFAARELFGA